MFSGVAIGALVATLSAQTPLPPFPVKRVESEQTWARDGWRMLARAKRERAITRKAKNVILFVGDGMGVSTLTAARILEGQLRGESGEENRLSFEEFPYAALSKTYSTNQQTPDSAPTMSAIVTGIKTDEGVISLDQDAVHADHRTVKGNETRTLLEMAEDAGKATGIVSTARITHATPAACYAHTPDRDWESDADIKQLAAAAERSGDTEMARRYNDAYNARFPDIARQLIESPYGDGVEVALGGGRSKFIAAGTRDPEYDNRPGERLDGRDLTKEWTSRHASATYVWNKAQLDQIDPKRTRRVLGLFEPSHMQYEFERERDIGGEPSLSEMTSKAIDILSTRKKGFFLMVEGGRVDHGHHSGNAYRALTEAIELSNAVRTAASKVDLNETLIVVTADHSHTLAIQGYPMRGNNILGLVREVGSSGEAEPEYRKDRLGLPFTTLSYANGPGYQGASGQPQGPKLCCAVPGMFRPMTGRSDLTRVNTLFFNYLQEAAIPLSSETHGGEDVAIFATGPNAYLIRGSMEENWIFYVMADAMRLGRK